MVPCEQEETIKEVLGRLRACEGKMSIIETKQDSFEETMKKTEKAIDKILEKVEKVIESITKKVDMAKNWVIGTLITIIGAVFALVITFMIDKLK